MKHILILVLAFVISPVSQAGMVTFSFTNLYSSAELLSGTGFWTVDESVLIPANFAEYAPVVTDWGFNWTTNVGPVSLNPSNGFLNSAAMSFDPQGELSGFTVCASAVVAPCGFSVHPSFEIIGGVGWGASISPDHLFSVVFGNTPVTQSVSDVPEPGPLPLLALGVLLLFFQLHNSCQGQRGYVNQRSKG